MIPISTIRATRVWRRAVRTRHSSGSLPRLMLVAWTGFCLVRAPVPVLHEHGGRVDGAVWSATLAGHLAKFHTHDADHDWLAWHVHWVSPSELAGGACPDDQSQQGPPVDQDMSLVRPLAISTGAAPAMSRTCGIFCAAARAMHPERIASVDGEVSPRHFLHFASAALPVRALLCVARC